MSRALPTLWPYLIGIGIALLPVHNQWLTDVTRNSNNEVMFFLPALGYLILIMGIGLFMLRLDWKNIDLTFGEKRVYVPLLAIVVAISLSGLTRTEFQDKIAPMFLGLVMFSLYAVSRVLGKRIFYPLAVGTTVASLGVIVYQAVNPGEVSGGYVFEGNYDVVAGYILLGAATFVHRWRPVLAGLALIAMLATGSPEALFSLAVVGIVVLIRQDWSKKLIPVAGIAIVLAGLWFGLGHGQELYSYATEALSDTQSSVNDDDSGRKPIGYRIEQIKVAMSGIQPLGTGYSVTEFREGIVHNVPLIMVQQLGYPGILAGLAWLWVTVYCFIKTKWKYAFALILSLSVFDHFIWTQLAPFWWAIVGVATTDRNSDLIFRRDEYGDNTTTV